MTRYSVRIEVESEETAAARLRSLLPELLGDAGYTTTGGATVIASWLVESVARPPGPFNGSRGRPESEHVRRGANS